MWSIVRTPSARGSISTRHRCILVDGGGGHVRVGLLAAAARVLAPDVCDLARAESATAAYELAEGGGPRSELGAQTTAAVVRARFLGHVDVLVSSRARPNDQRLYLAGVALAAPQAEVAAATMSRWATRPNPNATLRRSPTTPTRRGRRRSSQFLTGDRSTTNFSVTLRAEDGSRILRFAPRARRLVERASSSQGAVLWTCSRSIGAPSRRVLTSSCDSTCAAPTAMHRRRCSPRRTRARRGIGRGLGGPRGGAYDLAQKCDVEIWVAAAALRAVGGDAAAARLFVDECPGLLCTPGPRRRRRGVFRRAPTCRPGAAAPFPRRRGLSLPPQAGEA